MKRIPKARAKKGQPTAKQSGINHMEVVFYGGLVALMFWNWVA